MKKEVSHHEFRFARHLPITNDRLDDIHLVKENIVYKDGTVKPNLRIIKNFKRPFYVTKEHFRNHKQKKEYEHISKVRKFTAIQSNLPNEIAKQVGMTGYSRNQYRDVLKSPYLYGSDIPSTAFLAKLYEDKFGVQTRPYTVATLDIESDIDSFEITVISTAFGKTVRTAINRVMLKNYKLTTDEDIINKIKTLYKDNIDEKFKDFTLDITIHDNEVECIKAIFEQVHLWKPDFLSVWNVMFDIKMIANALVKNNIDPKMIFSDPNLPHEYKMFEIKEGSAKKKKADGTVMQIDVQDRWHNIKTASSFYIVDAMCAYSQIRVGSSKLIGGYGLDNVAKKEKVSLKLKFDGLVPDNLSKEDWHREMSRKHPLEYIVYNIGDNTMMLDLEESTHDLSVVLPTLAGYSHFDYFNSGPSKIVDKLFFEIMEDGLVLGTKPAIDDKDKILGLDGWINVIIKNYKSLCSANYIE